MRCMECDRPIGLLRRARSLWYCSHDHFQQSRAKGGVARANLLRADPGHEPYHNPATPMSCFFCGHEIGLVDRLRGHWYCSPGCMQEDVRRAGPDRSLRDLLAVGLGTGVAVVAVKLFAPQGDWVERLLPADYLGRFAGGSWTAETGDFRLNLMAEATQGLVRSANGLWQARSSFLFNGLDDTGEVRFESVGRGGVGYLFGADDSLDRFLGLSIRPLGRDFVLRTAIRNKGAIEGPVKEVALRTGLLGRPEQAFIVDKVRDRFSLFAKRPDNNWRWLHTWTESRLGDGRAGLFVDRGHDYWIRRLSHGRPPAG